MARIIHGNQDGDNGENQSYTIPGRGTVSRTKAVREVKEGKHDGFHVIEVDKTEYVRANPNAKRKDNVDLNQ